MSCLRINEKYQLFWEEEEEQFHVQFVSMDAKVRAIEFLDFVFDTNAELVGKKNRAYGVIKKTFAQALVIEYKADDFEHFLHIKSEEYFHKCQWIFPKSYLEENKEKILAFPKYIKNKIAWAFVKTTDIVPEGEKIYMTSLENEAGLTLTASPEDYIMIGCRGEIYNITREKFEKTYMPTNEAFDIFEQMASYIPEVKIADTDEFVCIDQMARLAYPKQDKVIYALKLEVRTKVFGVQNEGDYFLGNPGDYLAVRDDDLTDMYIIRGDIFEETYIQKTE